MLYLISYENADPLQERVIHERLLALNAKKLLSATWILESNKTLLDLLWVVRLGENMRILVTDVSHSHFATVPYSDVRGLVRQRPPEPPDAPDQKSSD